jgi:MYXO-CTERM domain-containing protein
MSLFLLQAFAPGDCLLTGLCGVRSPATGLPSGVMFLALGLVLSGAIGLWRERRRR